MGNLNHIKCRNLSCPPYIWWLDSAAKDYSSDRRVAINQTGMSKGVKDGGGSFMSLMFYTPENEFGKKNACFISPLL